MFIYNTIDSEANMNNAKVPPVLSMLSAAREIFNSRRNFRLIFLFTFLSGLFILIEFIFFITFIVSNITVIKAVSLVSCYSKARIIADTATVYLTEQYVPEKNKANYSDENNLNDSADGGELIEN